MPSNLPASSLSPPLPASSSSPIPCLVSTTQRGRKREEEEDLVGDLAELLIKHSSVFSILLPRPILFLYVIRKRDLLLLHPPRPIRTQGL